MINTSKQFYGQQENEKILYVVKPHFLATLFNLIKVYIIAVAVFAIFFMMAEIISKEANLLHILGVVISATIFIIGTKFIKSYEKRNVGYITDRRIVRFDPTTFFATNIRTLSWDEAVKVKTFSPNMLYKQAMVGTVVIHARTSVKTTDEEISHSMAADDIELKDVYLYRDLGNYIDKILYTYKQIPAEMKKIRSFIPKPKGKRY
ncbi:hypothetical protein ISR94_03225 [Candidatus Microgenomates bacterium]|nr:hypothetical protein [Candidatus Microgenomates bacterium]